MIDKSRIRRSISDYVEALFTTREIANELLYCEQAHLHEAKNVTKLSNPDIKRLFRGNFSLNTWGLSQSIAVVKSSIFDSYSMDHAITVEEVGSVVVSLELCVWSVSEVYSVNVFWNFTGTYLHYFIIILVPNWFKRTLIRHGCGDPKLTSDHCQNRLE